MSRRLDSSRRTLLHWYHKIVYFHRFGLLHRRFFEEFPGRERAQHFIRVVEPFELVSCEMHRKTDCSSVFDYVRKLYALPSRSDMPCISSKRHDEL